MDYECVGILVNTHGIKGEVRIVSDFELKSRVFVPLMKLFIGEEKECVIIKSYRPHKQYDMCVFEGFSDIQDVLRFKGKKVFVKREDIMEKDEYVDTDLIGMEAYYNEKLIGKVDDIENNNGYKLFRIGKKYVPYNSNFIGEVNLNLRKVVFINLEGII